MNASRFDIFFILPAFASIAMLLDGPNNQVEMTLSPLIQAGILAISSIIIASLTVFASAVDRKYSEDYIYQIIANASLIGIATCMLINMFWLLAMSIWDLPDLTGQNMAGATLLAWIAGYYWFRFRGIAP